MADTKSLAALLAEAQAEMPNPKKSREGQKGYQRYKYATLDAVVDIVKKPLNARGIFLTQPCDRAEDGTMRVQTVVMHEGERLVLDTKPYEYDTDPQEFGKRETYARRYSLLTAFGLAGEDETDGDARPKKPQGRDARPQRGQREKAGHAQASPEGKRGKMIARVAELKSELMGRGLTSEGLDAYLIAQYGVDSVDKLTDEQLLDYGKQLAKTADEYKGEKR